jgi:hypothetical protein
MLASEFGARFLVDPRGKRDIRTMLQEGILFPADLA